MMRSLMIVSLGCLVGCASHPPAAPEPNVRVERAANVEPSAADALVISIDGASVERIPAEGGRPLVSTATLITGPNNEPLAVLDSQGGPLLIFDTMSWSEATASPAFGRIGPTTTHRVVVPAGWSAQIGVSAAEPPGKNAASKAMPATLIITPQPGGAPPDLSIRAQGRIEEGAPEGATPPLRTARIPWPVTGSEGEFLLAARPRDLGTTGQGSPTLWRIHAAPAAGDPESSAEAERLVAQSEASAPLPSRWAAAIQSLRAAAPSDVRHSLALAALDANAELCGEAAAIASNAELPVIATGVASALEALAPDAGPEAASWAVERATLLAIGKLRSENKLSRGLAGAVSARFGEVGREPAVIADLAKISTGAPEFAQRLVSEHLILLDDLSPASRVRAYDWLRDHGAAPEGYDPLGPVRERRAAIEAHVEKSQAQP